MTTLVDGWYDVTDIAYGADPTGMTDSTLAILKAMAAMPITRPGTLYFPPGTYRCDNDIHLTRMCIMQGSGAATGDAPATTIEFAAGKGVIVEAQTTSADGFGGHSIIRQIEFIGETLELKDRKNNKDYVVGDRIRTPAHNDNRYYFECVKAGRSSNAELNPQNPDPESQRDFTFAYLPYTGTLRPSNGSTVVVGQIVHDMAAATDVYFECTTGGVIGPSDPNDLNNPTWKPTWKTVPCDLTADGEAIWIARRGSGRYLPENTIPQRTNGATVVVGQIVYDYDEAKSRYDFECTTGGVTGASKPTWKTKLGDTTADGTAVWTRYNSGYWLNDGTVVWACKLGAGIWMRQRAKIEDCRFYRFTNAGIHVQASGGYMQPTNANGFNIDTCRIVQCGVGVAILGSDSNTGTMIRLDVEGSGYLWNVIDPGNPSRMIPIPGGVGIWDGSYLGCQQFGNQVAACTGPGYITGQYDINPLSSNPIGGTMMGCYMEADCQPCIIAARAVIVGGDIAHADSLAKGGVTIGSTGVGGCNNLVGNDFAKGKHAITQFNDQGGDRSFLIGNDDNPTPPYYMSIAYQTAALGRDGWWSKVHGLDYAGRSFSGLTATEGRGWDWQPWGEFRGGSFNSFNGQYFVAFDTATLNETRLRGGEELHGRWQVGDRAELQSDGVAGGWTGYIVKKAGYRAQPWKAKTECNETSYCEPSSNGIPIPSPDGKVFKATAFRLDSEGKSKTGISEPTNWSTATVPGDTVLDNDVTWTLIGTVPEYNRIGKIDGDGQKEIEIADADTSLDAEQAAAGTTKFTGICTADRNVIYPSPTSDADAYQRTIRNLTTGGHAVVVGVSVGTSTTVIIAANKTAIVGFEKAGAYRVTADV